MPPCKHCGSQMEITEMSQDGSIGYQCPKNCTIEKAMEEHNQLEDITLIEIAFIDEYRKVITHCWKCQYDPIERREDNRDGDYGHFCPVCGYSLRYHKLFGEGMPRDMGKRFK